MVIGHPDPLSAVSSSINATIKILEVTYQLKAVGEQTADLLSTTRHVDFMVKEAHRLRRLKAGLLNTSERTMIDTVIRDTEDALRAVAKLVESCRVDKETKGGIGFGHRVMWVFRDNPSVRDKHQKLQVCNQSLTVAFNCLYSKNVVVMAHALEGRNEEPPPPYDPELKELLDWQNRRKRRKNIGEAESYSTKSISSMNTGSNGVTIASPPSPCLLTIPLEEDGGPTSFSTHFSQMSLEEPTMPTLELQPSVPNLNDSPITPATVSLKSDSRSPPLSEPDYYSHDDIRRTPSITFVDARNSPTSPTHEVPEYGSPPFAIMKAPSTFNITGKDGLETEYEYSTAWGQRSSSSGAVPDATPFKTSSSPALPLLAVTIPTSSNPNTGSDLGLRWLEPSKNQGYAHQKPIESPSLGKQPLPSRSNSDIQSCSAYESDRLDAVARAEEVMKRPNSAVSTGHGSVKRGGRSWLAFHATRGDMGHGINWDG